MKQIFSRKQLSVCAKKDIIQNLAPRTYNQKRYLELLNNPKPYIVVASGAAGSGKTLLAVTAAVNQLVLGKTDRIVISRPAVSVDEELGILPGGLNQKMAPWMRPVHDVLRLYFPASKIETMLKDKIVDVVPLATMRGMTFNNCWIICDEAQNTTISQMQMILTRIGKESKMVITGDPSQYDRGYSVNGLSDFIQRLEYQPVVDDDNVKLIDVITFTDDDVERHEVIKHVLKLYATP